MKQNTQMSQPATHYRVMIEGFLWNDQIYAQGDLIPRDDAKPQLDYALGHRQIELYWPAPQDEKPVSRRLGSALSRIKNL